jgi:hypothetical protein
VFRFDVPQCGEPPYFGHELRRGQQDPAHRVVTRVGFAHRVTVKKVPGAWLRVEVDPAKRPGKMLVVREIVTVI